jgi:hypothetical protein
MAVNRDSSFALPKPEPDDSDQRKRHRADYGPRKPAIFHKPFLVHSSSLGDPVAGPVEAIIGRHNAWPGKV